MRIAVIGSNGQVGSEVVSAARAAGLDAIELRHGDCEVADAASIVRALQQLRPGDAVVNTAAFHKTDECEVNADRALSVNALGAHRVAAAAADRGATTVYVSTDFVFDGAQRTPYVEGDAPHPINAYGATKAAGEALVCLAAPAHYVVRLSAVFGPVGASGKGGNFVEAMIAKARTAQSPQVVDDIIMAPTSAADAAALLVQLLQRRAPYGIYHLANEGACSWREFADAIFELIGTGVRSQPVPASSLTGPARRPVYSVLASERLASVGLQARDWREGLRDYLKRKDYLARFRSD